jgi:hypothetical protein
MLNIEIKTIPHNEQRYSTAGDWLYENGKLIINVSDTGDWKKEALVAVHELVEVFLCQEKNITQEMVDKFDMNFDGEGEPGDAPNSPYRHQHGFATAVERMLCAAMGVNWQEYDETVEKL